MPLIWVFRCPGARDFYTRLHKINITYIKYLILSESLAQIIPVKGIRRRGQLKNYIFKIVSDVLNCFNSLVMRNYKTISPVTLSSHIAGL